MKQVTTSLQVNRGIRSRLMSGARRRTTVASRQIACRNTAVVASTTATIQKSAPLPGVADELESG